MARTLKAGEPNPLLTKEALYKAYVEEGKTPTEIAHEAGIKPPGIYEYLRRYNIPIRDRVKLTKEQLQQLYIVESKTLQEISEIVSLSTTQVNYWLRQYGIERRSVSDYAITLDKEWLLEQKRLGKSWKEIRESLEMNSPLFFRVLKRLGIPPDRKAERVIKTNHRSQEDKFTVLEHRYIRQRDSFRCQMPGCRSRSTAKLETHHIIAVKDSGDTTVDNAITLCHMHHDSIKGHEQEYITLFQEIVKRNSQEAIDAISVKLRKTGQYRGNSSEEETP